MNTETLAHNDWAHNNQAHDDWEMLVEMLGGREALDRSARATGALARSRKIKNGADLLRLCMAYGPGGQSLRSGAVWAEATGLASLSNIALLKRLRKCTGWLEYLIGQALQNTTPDMPDRLVRIVDGSARAKGRQCKRSMAHSQCV